MISHVTEIECLSQTELKQLQLFKGRAEDLALSQAKYQNVPMASYSKAQGSRVESFNANTPDIDHVTNLALKFRFFYADKEPTQFEKVANLLRRKAKDEWAVNYIDRLKLFFKESMKSKDITANLGHPISNREIINLWFNSNFFHSDLKKREKLASIHQVVGEQASLFQLYLAIVKCSSHIQALYVVIHKLNEDNQVLCTPSYHFRLNKQNQADA